ncbi:MAG: hypothetical protein PHP38_03060 [Sphaerochaetaceae bacterium]|nr:hypothetical protein [Sphaerochaetaceae bacterium]
MEGMPLWLPIVFPIILFAITLIIILVLRHEDKKSRKLDLVKRYVVQHQAEMSQSVERFRSIAEAAEESIAKKQQETTVLVERLVHQQQEIQDHLDDLDKLQKTLAGYQEVMAQLHTTTEQAQLRTSQVKQEIAKVEQVHQLIDDFLARIPEISKTMEEKRIDFDTMVGQGQRNLDSALENTIIKAKERIDYLLESALNHTDLSFQTMIGTVQAFLHELNTRTEIIEDVVKRLTATSSETMLSLSNVLDERRDDLESRSRVLEELSTQRKEMEQQITAMTIQRASLLQEQTEIELQIERDKAQLDDLRERFVTSSETIEQLKKDDLFSLEAAIPAEVESSPENLNNYDESYDEYVGRHITIDHDLSEYTEEPQIETLFDLDIDEDLLDEYDEEPSSDAEFEEDLEEPFEKYIFDDITEEDYDYEETDDDVSEIDHIYSDEVLDEFEQDNEESEEEEPAKLAEDTDNLTEIPDSRDKKPVVNDQKFEEHDKAPISDMTPANLDDTETTFDFGEEKPRDHESRPEEQDDVIEVTEDYRETQEDGEIKPMGDGDTESSLEMKEDEPDDPDSLSVEQDEVIDMKAIDEGNQEEDELEATDGNGAHKDPDDTKDILVTHKTPIIEKITVSEELEDGEEEIQLDEFDDNKK